MTAILATCLVGGCGRSDAGGGGRPTIILITLDTTRADHLGCYGYARPTSPNLDRLAAESLVYDRAIAPGTWTLPSHASLFTGKFTASHGMRYDPEGSLQLTSAIDGPQAWGHYRARALAKNERTLAMVLREHGYATGAVVAGPWLKRVFGLDRGFDHFDDDHITSLAGRRADNVTDKALQWLAASEGAPRFGFLNYFDPHGPYMAPEDFERRFFTEIGLSASDELSEQAAREAAYDAEIRYMDHHLGRLFDGLRTLGLYEDAWIIVTADHGELLGEHGELGHGDTPWQEVVHVPLIVKAPGPDPPRGRRGAWLQLIDVMPMILDGLGIEWPADIQGGSAPDVGHPIMIESRTLPLFMKNGDWMAWIDDGVKYIWNSRGAHRLFDLDADPSELTDLIDDHETRVRSIQKAMHAYLVSLPGPGSEGEGGVVDKDTMDALRSLGYTSPANRHD